MVGRKILGSLLNSFAVSGSKKLLYSESFLGGASSLVFAGESWLANQLMKGSNPNIENKRVRASHLRSSLEGGHQIELAAGDSIESTLAFGYLHNDSNLQQFFGLQLAGGISYENPAGLTVSGTGAANLSREDSPRSMKLTGLIEYDRDRDKLRVNLQVAPVWSQATANYNSGLWNSSSMNSDSTAPTNQTNIAIELGYGFRILDDSWKFTPYGSIELARNGHDLIQLGKRFEYGEYLSIEFSGSEEMRAGSAYDREIYVKGTIGW